MAFTIFYDGKTNFQALNTTSSKSGKIDIFAKGFTHFFGRKMTIFPPFFLGNMGQECVFYDILLRRNAFLGSKNKKFKYQKKAIFSTFFFLAVKARKMSFTIFYNKKTPFQAIKTRSSNIRKIDIFLRGLTHDFGLKLAIFPTFFFQGIQARKIKNNKFKKSKN